MAPKRIQLSRKKGWRKPENTVVVSRPSKWGNPHTIEDAELWLRHGVGMRVVTKEQAREQAAYDFRRSLKIGHLRFFESHVRDELRGKNLACWCPLPKPGEPDHCHAAVLLEIANAPTVNAEEER